MKLALLPASAAVLLALSLAACSSTGPAAAPAAAPAVAPSDAAGSEPAPAPAAAGANGPNGCELVTADMFASTVGLTAGPCTTTGSFIAGPDTGKYAAIGADVQISSQPDLYLTDVTCSQGAVDGALAVPGADRGYAANGSFCVVKGTTGVFLTAVAPSGSTTAEQWLALAEATLSKL